MGVRRVSAGLNRGPPRAALRGTHGGGTVGWGTLLLVSPEIIVVWLLSLLGAVVVVLTRVRLGREFDDGTTAVSSGVLNVHTGVGAAASVVWALFLAFPSDSVLGGVLVGLLGLGLWWITAIAGVALLLRWMPSRGRHAPHVTEDDWAEGPGLSLLAHVGLALGVLILTWAFATSVV